MVHIFLDTNGYCSHKCIAFQLNIHSARLSLGCLFFIDIPRSNSVLCCRYHPEFIHSQQKNPPLENFLYLKYKENTAACPLIISSKGNEYKFAELQSLPLSPTAQSSSPFHIAAVRCWLVVVGNKVCSFANFIILSRPKDGHCTEEGGSINNKLIYLWNSAFFSLCLYFLRHNL